MIGNIVNQASGGGSSGTNLFNEAFVLGYGSTETFVNINNDIDFFFFIRTPQGDITAYSTSEKGVTLILVYYSSFMNRTEKVEYSVPSSINNYNYGMQDLGIKISTMNSYSISIRNGTSSNFNCTYTFCTS